MAALEALELQVAHLTRELQQHKLNVNREVDKKVEKAMREYKKHCHTVQREATAALKQLVELGLFNVEDFQKEVKRG